MAGGLTTKEANRKIEQGLGNVSGSRMTRSYEEIIKGNLFTYFNLINTILFVLVLLTGEYTNGFFYATIVANAFIGIIQEIKAKKIIDQMSILVLADIDVKRDGSWTKMKANCLVPNDIVRLESGIQIPADSIVLDGYLEVNESMLTGESKRLIKQKNDKLFAGTLITSGKAECEVIHTGKDNFSETIMKDARKYQPSKSLLQEDLQKLLKVISIIIVPMGVILFITQFNVLHLTWKEAILKTVSALVGMIPEGLVVLTSVALVVSTIRLAKQKILVQDLYSIESLARIDVLCLDKTGTLTKGTMQVDEVVPLEDASLDHIHRIMGSYVRVFHDGNATDAALGEHFKTNDFYKEIDVLPFSSDRKYAGVSFLEEGTFYLGAANFLFPQLPTKLKKLIKEYSNIGDRVVVLAHSIDERTSKSNLPTNLEPIAIIAIQDVLRDHVQDTMEYFAKQGVTLKVISGDDPSTVSSLALKAGIQGAENYVDMSQNKYRDIEGLVGATVFGRVLPDQKKAMVKALQKQGHTVAMVGDGVNDVPALKTADVGVAMAAGASAARDSANIVLLESEFGMVPNIVNEGRRVINNISRASSMYLVKTVFSIFLSFYVIIGHREYPFLPIHLSLVSTFGVGIPTFFLQLEPSFERVRGGFFQKALKNAIPSSITVLLTAIFVELLQTKFGIIDTQYNAMLLILTGFTYLYTLYKVYFPPDRLRIVVISSMAACIIASMLAFHEYLEVSLEFLDLLVVIPGFFIVPVVISAISRVYSWFGRHIKRIKHWFKKIK